MKKFIAPLFVVAMFGSGMLSMGCSHEVAHEEHDRPTLMGGNKHEETTVYKNADGTMSTEKSSSTSR